MKHTKLALNISFIIFILFSLAYKNIIAPKDTTSIFAMASDMAIPLFMIFSMLNIFFKTKKEKKEQSKPSKEDNAFYSSIGSSEDFNKKN